MEMVCVICIIPSYFVGMHAFTASCMKEIRGYRDLGTYMQVVAFIGWGTYSIQPIIAILFMQESQGRYLACML